jgi:hypothetical protein
VLSTGAGSSSVGVLFYGANWTVTASGTGTYDVLAVAKDPWNIALSDLSTISGSTYSVYIPFSMLGGQSDTTGSKISSGFGFDVTYATASGSTTLVDVLVNGTHAIITPTTSFGSNLQFFQQSDSTTAPTGSTTPGTQIVTSALQSLVSSSIDSNGNLVSPINLGIVLSGISIPTTLMADGSVAQIGVTAFAFESAVVPEASTLILLMTGLGGW